MSDFHNFGVLCEFFSYLTYLTYLFEFKISESFETDNKIHAKLKRANYLTFERQKAIGKLY